jgi:hypothetical protein
MANNQNNQAINDPNNPPVNNVSPEDRRTMYATIIQLVCNAEQVSWNRLYNLLTCNTILILSWAALQSSQIAPLISVKFGLSFICLLGFLLGILWSVQGHRGRRFLNHYVHFGRRMENEPQYMPMPLEFTIRLRDSLDELGNGNDAIYEPGNSVTQKLYNLCGSRTILVIVPIVFSALFFAMLLITWKDLIIKLFT